MTEHPSEPVIRDPELDPSRPEPDPSLPPASDPDPTEPPRRDPPPEPSNPGEPVPTVEDPEAPGEPPGPMRVSSP